MILYAILEQFDICLLYVESILNLLRFWKMYQNVQSYRYRSESLKHVSTKN